MKQQPRDISAILAGVFHTNDFIEGSTVWDETHIVEVETSTTSGYN